MTSKSVMRGIGEALSQRRIEDPSTLLRKTSGITVYDPGHPRPSAVFGPVLCSPVELRDGGGKRGHQVEIQGIAAGQTVEQSVLIEAGHFDDPVHGLAGSPEREGSVRPADNGHDAAVERWRCAAVDADLGLAHRLAPRRGGKVQVVVLDGSLQFPGSPAGQEHDRCVRIDSLDGFAAMCCRGGEEFDRGCLVFGDHLVWADDATTSVSDCCRYAPLGSLFDAQQHPTIHGKADGFDQLRTERKARSDVV